ncbi:MAG: glycoside hydrolase family 6 protein [Thermoleophilaceae bacterium]
MRYAALTLARLAAVLAVVVLTALGATSAQARHGEDGQQLPPLPVDPPPLPVPTPTPTPPPVPPLPTGGNCRSATQPAGVDPRGAARGAPNPLNGLTFFVDPDEPAWHQWKRLQRQGKTYDASLVEKLATRPKFRWFGKWTRHGPKLVSTIREYLAHVDCTQPGAVPLMAVMRHQGRACNPHYRAGGRREDARQRGWYRRFARGVGSHRVVIAFEPDSLGTVHCLARSRRKARLRTLRYGVKLFSRLPNATVYLEAGASDWDSARHTARQLRYIGIRRVRGFMLNVTHYDWTSRNIRHGRKISRLVGGKHFIISTSNNGRGPVHFRNYRGRHDWRVVNVWCHPLMRGLGPAPTADTHKAKVDAYMYIGRAGYSSGHCNGGPSRVGAWWPARALMFGKYATQWIGPPHGSRNGFFGHLSLRQLGG